MKAIMTMMGVGALVVAMARLATAQVSVVYQQNFENLQAGQLVGQDNWQPVVDINGSSEAIQIGVGTGRSRGGNLGTLDNMQILNAFGPNSNLAYRPLGASPSTYNLLDPTQIYTLTFDADGYDGAFGFGGARYINGGNNTNAEGTYMACIVYGGSPSFGQPVQMAFDTRFLTGGSVATDYQYFAYPSGTRASYKIILNGPAGTISAYYNYTAEGGGGSGYTLAGTQNNITAAQISYINCLSFDSIGTGSNPGLGIDNILLTQGVPLPGDVNFDGHVNAADIPVLEQALTNPSAYINAYPNHGLTLGDLGQYTDVTGNSQYSNANLQALENLLIAGGGSTNTVPEPATLVLLALGGGALLLRRRCGPGTLALRGSTG